MVRRGGPAPPISAVSMRRSSLDLTARGAAMAAGVIECRAARLLLIKTGNMKSLGRTLILWIALAALCLLLATAAHDHSAPFWLSHSGWAYLLPLTVCCMAWATKAL